MLAAGVVGAFQMGKLPAALPLIRAELDFGLVAAGWVISAISAIGVLTAMIWGMVSDRLGHRQVVLGGLALIAIGGVAGSFSWDAGSLLATRIFEGAGYVAVVTAGPALLGPLATARDRSVAMGVWSFYLPFGLSGMVVMSPLLLANFSWRGAWLFNAGLAIITMIAVAIAIRKDTPPAAPDARAAWVGMARTMMAPGPLTLAVCFGAYSLIHLSVVAFMPTFLIERRGVGVEEAALLTALVMFMNAPGCLLGGWLIRIRVPAWIVVAAGYLGMLACGLGVFSEELPGGFRYLLAMLLPFSGGVIPPALLDRAPRHALSPALVATTIGLIIQVVSLGQLIGPPILAALVTGAGSWQAAAWLTVTASVVGLAGSAALRVLDRPDAGGG